MVYPNQSGKTGKTPESAEAKPRPLRVIFNSEKAKSALSKTAKKLEGHEGRRLGQHFYLSGFDAKAERCTEEIGRRIEDQAVKRGNRSDVN